MCILTGDYIAPNQEVKQVKRIKKTLQPLAPMGEVRPTPIISDPQGSYTGRPIENYEMPVQDADDL